jgi:sugar/nucleoside kinase (ribokinase family)
VLVACLGDVLLDVVVDLDDALVADDDTPATITVAAGGQAANVAAWVAVLGGRSRVFGPLDTGSRGRLLGDALSARGVEMWGGATSRGGTVVSLLSAGTRSLASDPGDLGWLEKVRPGPWLDGADWLFVSGYALLRASDPRGVLETAAAARALGTRVAVDLSSASMVRAFGVDGFSSLCRSLRPAVLFATEAELATDPGGFGADEDVVLVLKRGSRGTSFVVAGVADDRSPKHGRVVDVTGAGDALAAGYLVGGPDLAMEAAARCVAIRGAQPAGAS